VNRTTQETRQEKRREKGLLVGAGLEDYGESGDVPALDELAELAATAGVTVIGRFWQRRAKPDAALYVGKGKVEEIASAAREEGADVVLFDNELSPRQVRNLEKEIGCKVIDRSEIILDIFATHAQTLAARLQVELAQLRYTLPRLKRMWTHLDRVTGQGGVGSRGPGEKQIETDRRLIDRRLQQLEREIEEIKQRRERQVKTRDEELTVALVGYTNAGKSTLMNRLTGAGVLQADMLFATLDTKTSDFELPNGKRVLLSDTVGFIDKLPHHLVASFHATLEEVRQARLLLHVVDASHPAAEGQIETVHRVLHDELEVDEAEEVIVLNKIDLATEPAALALLRERHPDSIAVSAVTGEGMDELIARIQQFDERSRETLTLMLDAADGKTLAELARLGDVLETHYEGDKVRVAVNLPKEVTPHFRRFALTS